MSLTTLLAVTSVSPDVYKRQHVSFAGGKAHLGVISGQPPRGLCGSGILETVSQGVAERIISPSGRLCKDSPLTDTDENGKRRIVLDRERGLFVTQGDVRQVQLCNCLLYTSCVE